MSYSIDVYRGDTKAQHNIIDFAAYVTMFPQLIAGPIVRYRTIADELEANKKGGRRSLRSENFGLGMQRFILGLGKRYCLPIRPERSGLRYRRLTTRQQL